MTVSRTPVPAGGERAAGSLLTRLLEAPALAAAVQALPAPLLGRLIDRLGLEDAGEIVALATTAQLTDLFDQDLWRAERPGEDEIFDPDRFALWLEVMLEAGDHFTADRVVALDPDLLTMALGQLVLVLDHQRLGERLADAAEDERLAEKALESSLTEELGDYLVIARKPDAWDAVFTLLVALDRDHHDFLERLMERLDYISNNEVEDGGGLHQVLSAAQTAAEDAAAARQDRRGQQGYVAPADARAFLVLARQSPAQTIIDAREEDPLTRAYFRDFLPARPATAARGSSSATDLPPAVSAGTAHLAQVLADADLLPAPAPALPAASIRADPFAAALAALQHRDPSLHLQRLRELNYLANVLISGAGIDDRRLRPVEAAELVLEVVRLGLQRLPAPDLQSVSAVQTFRLGWSLLHQRDRGGHSPSAQLRALLSAPL